VERGIVAALRQKYGSGPQRLAMTAYLDMGRNPEVARTPIDLPKVVEALTMHLGNR